MADLKEKIKKDVIEAMKAGDKLKVSTLRLLNSNIKNMEIEKGGELNDSDVQQVITREIKRRKEAKKEFTKGNRPELAEKEAKEEEMLSVYMPKQLNDDELKGIIQKAIDDTGAESKKDMGKVMGSVMPQVRGKADGTRVNKIVSELLE